MKSTVSTIIRKSLEEQIAFLSHERAVAVDQWRGTIDEVTRLRLEEQIKQTDKKLHEIERDLAKTESADASAQQDWQTHLPQINFKEAVTITEELLLTGTGNNAALFLVPSSLAMGGK